MLAVLLKYKVCLYENIYIYYYIYIYIYLRIIIILITHIVWFHAILNTMFI